LRGNQILERLSRSGEEIGEHGGRRSRDRATLGLDVGPTVAPHCQVRSLYGEILRDADQCVGVSGLKRIHGWRLWSVT